MQTIRFHFFNNPGIGGWIIRKRLGSTISHVGMEFDNGEFYHSTFKQGMVRQDDYCQHHTPVSTTEITVPDANAETALVLCRALVGTHYDYKAIIGFTLGQRYEDAQGLFCSEIGRQVAEAATGIYIHWPKLCAPHELRIMLDTYSQTLHKGSKGIDL